MTDYLTSEANAIRAAYKGLEHLAWRTDQSMIYRLDIALRQEKRERATIHAARAVVIKSFLKGFDNPDKPIADLYSVADGCAGAMIIGACVARRWADLVDDDLRRAIEEANEANAAYIQRVIQQ